MKFALITGATSGIGYELSKIFAKNKINLILVARNEKRLNEIVQEFHSYEIHMIIYAKDLSILQNAEEIYNDIQNKNIWVEYVVNNAGFGINDDFTEIPWHKEFEMYSLNMITLAYFTKMFAKEMKIRKSGYIMNVGSTGSFQPGPYMAGYCATKGFVLYLSEAINRELKGTGVSVTALCPGVTDTAFHDVAKTKKSLISKVLSNATAEEVAIYGYKLMMKKKSFGIHGFMNNLMIFSNRFASRNMVAKIAGKLMKPAK